MIDITILLISLFVSVLFSLLFAKFMIKQSNVHRRLNTSGYYTYEKCMETVQNTIIDLWESANVK